MSERPEAGSIVVVDWRTGAKPAEPTKIRPAIVVDDHGLFPGDYPNCVVVPLTHDEKLAYASFSERIDPTPENGADATSWALAHHVTTVSLQRVRSTRSRISRGQLSSIRRRIASAVAL